MNFFFDNNLPPRFAAAINALISPEGDTAIHLRDKFPQSISDIDWIAALQKEGGLDNHLKRQKDCTEQA